jgi:hypothetical protein
MDMAVEMLLKAQDQLITRQQALLSMTQAEITGRLGKFWQVVLPGVYATFTGALTMHHRTRAALLYAGPESMVNDLCALRTHRMAYLPDDPFSRVLVHAHVQRSSRDFVVLRRTTRLPRPLSVGGLPVVPLARALCEFGARHPDERDSFAVVAAALQKGRVRLDALVQEIERSPNRGRPKLVRIAEKLGAGVRSAPEGDFRRLVMRSRILPQPLWNCLLRLPDGREFSPDALFVDAGLIHETNGRKYHSGEAPVENEDPFEDMQRRNDALVTADLTVLHNSPHRIRTESCTVIAEVEECYARLAGRGLPDGVVIMRPGPPGTMWQRDRSGSSDVA